MRLQRIAVAAAAAVAPKTHLLKLLLTQRRFNSTHTEDSDSRFAALEKARKKLAEDGLDPPSFWEQPIAWGDQDSFQHVNNVRYFQFLEAASLYKSRFRWLKSIGYELGGDARAESMVRGQGVSLILKSIQVQFRRPVTFPDMLLIGYRPKAGDGRDTKDHAAMNVTASVYSLDQGAYVAHSDEVLVWYDYTRDRPGKCDPGEAVWEVIRGRGKGR